MAINYPGSLDDFTNPAAGNTLDSPSHSGQHSDLNDAVEALEAKVGIGASPAGSATAGQVLTAQGGGTAIWATPAESGGSVLLNVTTIGTAVSSISLPDNTFTSSYSYYRVIFDATNSTFTNDTNTIFKFRASGTDSVTNYNYQGWSSIGATLANTTGASLPDQFMGSVLAVTSDRFTTIIDITGIAEAKETKFIAHNVGMSGGTKASRAFYGFHTTATAYDSMTFGIITGSITGGKIYVYGFRNA